MTTTRKLLWVLTALGLAAAIYRFAFGLGAATNLSDNFPWGLWIAVDVMGGIALAAGGFTVALVVYVLNLKRFRPLLRPAILTAFIGYLLATLGIVFDIGQPQRIWFPLIKWNIRSPLFEVALCVMAYLLVLALEFSPAVYESRRWARAVRLMKAIMIPVVILGIVISTLHQSSLGALLLIAPGRLHPLYFTALLPWLFFISAIAAGLAMTTVEAYLSGRAYGRATEAPLLASLAKASWWVLALYAVLRFGDLALNGRLGLLLEGSVEANFFLLETAVGLALPLVLLAMPALRADARRLVWVQGLVILGVLLNRADTLLVGMAKGLGGSYFPSLVEIAVTIGLTAAGVLIYALAVERLPVLGETEDRSVRVQRRVG